ncbi:hypothetical protein B566_EDAN002499 [Ephemera danica]|nr:hypothetical protein B566_EDAN002499 [Ephemera danica]
MPPSLAAKAKKKKKKKVASDAAVSEVTKALQGTQLQWPGSTEKQSKEPPIATEPAKRLKNLKKRLREVELLEQKMNSGELKNPDKDQLQKVKRKDDLKEQIAELEEELEG